jgi:hypothetical protein
VRPIVGCRGRAPRSAPLRPRAALPPPHAPGLAGRPHLERAHAGVAHCVHGAREREAGEERALLHPRRLPGAAARRAAARAAARRRRVARAGQPPQRTAQAGRRRRTRRPRQEAEAAARQARRARGCAAAPLGARAAQASAEVGVGGGLVLLGGGARRGGVVGGCEKVPLELHGGLVGGGPTWRTVEDGSGSGGGCGVCVLSRRVWASWIVLWFNWAGAGPKSGLPRPVGPPAGLPPQPPSGRPLGPATGVKAPWRVAWSRLGASAPAARAPRRGGGRADATPRRSRPGPALRQTAPRAVALSAAKVSRDGGAGYMGASKGTDPMSGGAYTLGRGAGQRFGGPGSRWYREGARAHPAQPPRVGSGPLPPKRSSQTSTRRLPPPLGRRLLRRRRFRFHFGKELLEALPRARAEVEELLAALGDALGG